MLRWESPSVKRAKLHTVGGNNNRVHPTRSLSSSPLASTINCSPGSQALLEVTHGYHILSGSLYYCLFAPHIFRCCSSRTFHSRWTAHSAQPQRRSCNSNMNSLLFVDKSGCSSNGKVVSAKLLPLIAKYTLPFNKSAKYNYNLKFDKVGIITLIYILIYLFMTKHEVHSINAPTLQNAGH